MEKSSTPVTEYGISIKVIKHRELDEVVCLFLLYRHFIIIIIIYNYCCFASCSLSLFSKVGDINSTTDPLHVPE